MHTQIVGDAFDGCAFAAPESLDRARMKRISEDLVILLKGFLTPESLLWLADFRPDVLRYLDEAEQLLADAWQHGDRKGFAAAVRFCSDKYLSVSRIYQKRQRWLTYSGTLDGE